MIRALAVSAGLCLAACQPAASTDPIDSEPRAASVRPDETVFADVLAEYQALNARLDRVGFRLRLANAALCPDQTRDPGFTTHRLEDYPLPLQAMAQAVLGLEPGGLYIRSVRRGTSAEQQGLQAGDRIVGVNDNRFSPDPIMATYNDAVWAQGFGAVLSKITVDTGTREFVARIRSDTVCDIPTSVMSSDDINGHTDGREVFITSALMRAVPDDDNLALVVAHEMGHVIARHAELPPSRALELDADRRAVVMMTRAGFDVDAALDHWAEAVHPHDGGTAAANTHPTTQARLENFRRERARVSRIEDISTLDFAAN